VRAVAEWPRDRGGLRHLCRHEASVKQAGQGSHPAHPSAVPSSGRDRLMRAVLDDTGLGLRVCQVTGPALDSGGSTSTSWLRELMSSLLKTLPRWYSAVRGLMNSRAAICGFERPSRARRA